MAHLQACSDTACKSMSLALCYVHRMGSDRDWLGTLELQHQLLLVLPY